jgi:Rps23 Pro-64 3,4-dihydroxylase Tpa1-like proline 4-hydroxylase
MHREIYNFFNNLSTDSKITHFVEPFPLWIIDDFLPIDIYDAAIKEISNITADNWSTFENASSFRTECRNLTQAPLLETITNSFNSSKSINWLQELTGISALLPDPHLRGGGLCRIQSGSKLDLHTDFNWNDQIRLNRKVNLILYLNETWDTAWGGNLEFWNNNKTSCIQSIKPTPNRLAVWIYDTELVHGFPEPLTTPNTVSRDNLILFYYTSNAIWEKSPRRSQF